MKKQAPHPEDIAQARSVETAVSFSAYFRRGPRDKWVERDIPTYQQAREIADGMAARHGLPQQGKQGLVYAITPQGFSVLCSPDVMALVSKEAA